jgi:hypothetical protein
MGAGVATVGRRVYAVGLYWENSPAGRVAQAAKEAARQPGQQVDFFALRAGNKDGRVPQFGLGQKIAGHKNGMPVFAACIANQQPGSWAGAFRVREGTAVVVVRDELILPDGDQIYLNETEARELLLQEISFGGLQRIYAPEAWAISGSDSMPISLLLDDKHDITLRAIEVPKQAILLGGLAVLFLIVILGVGFYMQSASTPAPQPVAATVPILERPRPVYPPPDRKWEKAPRPTDVIESCRQALEQIPAAYSGWRLNPFKCDGRSIALSWLRDKGMTQPPKGASVNETGSLATKTLTLSTLSPRDPEQLLDQVDVTKRFLAQDWPGNISRDRDDPPPPPPPGYQGEWNPPPNPWVKRSFTLKASELPGSVPVYIDHMPGVIINVLSYNPGQSIGEGSWVIEGVIYENRN